MESKICGSSPTINLSTSKGDSNEHEHKALCRGTRSSCTCAAACQHGGARRGTASHDSEGAASEEGACRRAGCYWGRAPENDGDAYEDDGGRNGADAEGQTWRWDDVGTD